MRLLSELKKIRVQHVSRDENGLEVKTDVDVLTDASAVTMDGGDLKTGIESMINTRIENLIDGAPQELDTLKEIADELSKNQSGVTTILKKLGDKVDKDGDKVLSTNDFTNVLKKKLDGIEDGAQKNVVTSVNGQIGDITIEAGNGNVDLSGYVKKEDLKNRINIPLPNKRTWVLTQKEYDSITKKDEDIEYNIRQDNIKVICIINQFLAGKGGEEAADIESYFEEGAAENSAAGAINAKLTEWANAEVVGTLVVPDNSLQNDNKLKLFNLLGNAIVEKKPDIIIAGPACNNSKFAKNCCELALTIMGMLGIPVVTSIHSENESYKKYQGLIYIDDGSSSPVNDIPGLVRYALQVLSESYDITSYLKTIMGIAYKIHELDEKVDGISKSLEAYINPVIISQSKYAKLSDEEKNKKDALYFLI